MPFLIIITFNINEIDASSKLQTNQEDCSWSTAALLDPQISITTAPNRSGISGYLDLRVWVRAVAVGAVGAFADDELAGLEVFTHEVATATLALLKLVRDQLAPVPCFREHLVPGHRFCFGFEAEGRALCAADR